MVGDNVATRLQIHVQMTGDFTMTRHYHLQCSPPNSPIQHEFPTSCM